ncbi:MAG: hypothetical protein K2X44_06705, partial [Magnetospirillum sp.]|nr:hypothetical protein [Magnetospirillum sp.]
WHVDPAAAEHMDSLQVILNCASAQGCGECVRCSEAALELFLKVARESCVASGNAAERKAR